MRELQDLPHHASRVEECPCGISSREAVQTGKGPKPTERFVWR